MFEWVRGLFDKHREGGTVVGGVGEIKNQDSKSYISAKYMGSTEIIEVEDIILNLVFKYEYSSDSEVKLELKFNGDVKFNKVRFLRRAYMMHPYQLDYEFFIRHTSARNAMMTFLSGFSQKGIHLHQNKIYLFKDLNGVSFEPVKREVPLCVLLPIKKG